MDETESERYSLAAAQHSVYLCLCGSGGVRAAMLTVRSCRNVCHTSAVRPL